MRKHCARDPTKALHDNIGGNLAPRRVAARRKYKRYRRIEVRTRNRPENGDDHDEDRARRDRVAEKRNRLISTCESLGHDAGADDGRDQDSRAETLCQKALR